MPRSSQRCSWACSSLLLAVAALVLPPSTTAQDPAVPSILFTDVRVFNGIDAALSGPVNVLVQGDRIQRISADPLALDDATTTVVAGDGRTLMPGLIDAHVHLVMSTVPLAVMMTADPGYTMLAAGGAAEEMLLRGFTSVRDLGGPTFGLKRAIDEDRIAGPRIWPSGATISQTSGHGDFRTLHDIPRTGGDPAHFTERLGFTAVADGRAEVLRRVREQLMQGASQIKVMAGGGVSSNYDPLDVTQYTDDEMRAAVEAATAWGTYVTVHAYTPDAIQSAIRAGVRSIDHGQLADEETVRLMADQGIWWSLQPFLDDEDSIPFPDGSDSREKQLRVVAGSDSAYELAKQYGVDVAWGSDVLFDPRLATRQGAQLAKMTRWFSPGEVLKMATSDNARFLALSGPRSPYPGTLGVVAEGALADLLLVDGNPLEDIDLIANPDSAFVVIMKGGRIVKNTLR